MFDGGVATENESGGACVRLEYWQSLHARLVAGAKQRLALEAAEARDLVLAEEAEIWRRFGYMSMLEYMQRELFYEGHTARERLRVANKLFGLPVLAEAFREGELSFSALKELTRIVVPETEEEWREAAAGKSAREVERMVSGLKEGASPGDRRDPKLEKYRITWEVDGEAFALMRAKRIALENERGQRMTDSEVVKALSRVERTADGAPTPTLHAVTTCRVCKQSSLVAGGIETPVSEATRERLLCDHADAGDLESNDTRRLASDIPTAIRRRVLIRDRFACTVPGCTSCRNIDLHHIVFRSRGGTHTVANLTTLCDGHHREAHEGLLVVRGCAPGLVEFAFHRAGEDDPHRSLATVPQSIVDEEKSHVGRQSTRGRSDISGDRARSQQESARTASRAEAKNAQ
jgi:hypothetical protein